MNPAPALSPRPPPPPRTTATGKSVTPSFSTGWPNTRPANPDPLAAVRSASSISSFVVIDPSSNSLLRRRAAPPWRSPTERPKAQQSTSSRNRRLRWHAMAIQADSADPEAVRAAISDTAGRFGGLEVLVNNAGTSHQAPVEDFPMAESTGSWPSTSGRSSWPSRPPYRTSARWANHHHRQRAGRPGPDQRIGVYSLSKAAVAGLSRNLARELVPRASPLVREERDERGNECAVEDAKKDNRNEGGPQECVEFPRRTEVLRIDDLADEPEDCRRESGAITTIVDNASRRGVSLSRRRSAGGHRAPRYSCPPARTAAMKRAASLPGMRVLRPVTTSKPPLPTPGGKPASP